MENNFKDELDILNDVYSELIDAIENKPEVQDYEKSRIYTENLISYLNKWVVDVKNVRNLLEKRGPIKDITADNRPA